MEEPEVPTEHLHEHIHEHAEGAHGKSRWTIYLAVSTAFMAVLAAIASLQAGHYSNEALIEQIKASDQWAYYQAKGIKYDITQSMMLSNPDKVTPDITSKLNKYKTDQEEIKTIATEAEAESAEHLRRHIILARSVTLLQVSIAISAIAILTRKKFLWYFGIIIALLGAWQLIMGNL